MDFCKSKKEFNAILHGENTFADSPLRRIDKQTEVLDPILKPIRIHLIGMLAYAWTKETESCLLASASLLRLIITLCPSQLWTTLRSEFYVSPVKIHRTIDLEVYGVQFQVEMEVESWSM